MTTREAWSGDLGRVGKDLLAAGHNLWLAGLGAVSQMEKDSRDLFDTLVERGRKMETRQFKALDRTVAGTSDRLREMSDKMENGVEDALKRVLSRVGMPTRDDVRVLSARIDALSRKVDQVAADEG